MKSAIWLGLGLAVTLALGIGALLVGWHLGWAGNGTASVLAMHGYRGVDAASTCVDGTSVPAMRGALRQRQDAANALCTPDVGASAPAKGRAMTIEMAQDAFVAYLAESELGQLRVSEIREFQHSYYANVMDPEADTSAMELVLDKSTGVVGPEVGPNMMWNVVYGMHRGRGMMASDRGDHDIENALSPEAAISRARTWLADNRPDEVPATSANAFPGYYTIDTVNAAGETVGMLSVHGQTGQVWYHTWHGASVAAAGSRADLP